MAAVTRTRRSAPDAVCAAAIDLAREAASEAAEPGAVGEHLGFEADGERVVSHSFACTTRGYRGWLWTVTLARASRAKLATVSEVSLLPGPESVLAPEWLPWSERLRPGDMGVADVLPHVDDDPRLEQGWEATGAEDVDRVALTELGLGRPRVLSREGRDDAADRWHTGDLGPSSETAKAAAQSCSSCGFLVPTAGALRQVFGICANEWSPADGRVVALDFGCGAHSETDVERAAEHSPAPILDELGYDTVTS